MTWTDRILEPWLALLQPWERIYWLYLLSALLIALLLAFTRRNREIPFSLLDALKACFPTEIYKHPGTRLDLAFYLINVPLFGLFCAPLLLSSTLVASAAAPHLEKLFAGHTIFISGLGIDLALTIAVLLATDFGLFFTHALQHKIPILWEFHKIHHSAQVMTPITVYRMHPIDDLVALSAAGTLSGLVLALFHALFDSDISLLSISRLNIFTFAFYFFAYNLRHSHIWLDFGPLASWLLISPAQHQIHHSNKPIHFDKNFGFMFSFWDRALGSLYLTPQFEKIEFGIGGGEDQHYESLPKLYVLPFKKSYQLLKSPGFDMNKATALALVFALLAYVSYDAFLTPPPIQNKAPSLEIEKLTWIEIASLLEQGIDTAIIPTGGTEQNGPHLTLGKHNDIIKFTANEIASRLGNTLVAPILPYVPEGDINPPTEHMRFKGTLTLPEPVFEAVLEATARSLAAHGFKKILFLGDSYGNQAPQFRVAAKLNAEWAEQGIKACNIDHYYAANGQTQWLQEQGESPTTIGQHAGIRDSSELLAVNPKAVRINRIQPPSPQSPSLGFSGDPTRASSKRGKKLLELKINAALNQIQSTFNKSEKPAK